jgi:hypothetical protein
MEFAPSLISVRVERPLTWYNNRSSVKPEIYFVIYMIKQELHLKNLSRVQPRASGPLDRNLPFPIESFPEVTDAVPCWGS